MSIDATDVRDLINNPEGRTPYPEDNKLTLGSAPSGGSSDEYILRARDHNHNIELALLKNDTALAPEIDFPSDSFFYETIGNDVVIHAPKARATVYTNSNLDDAPGFGFLPSELDGSEGDFGYNTNNWSIWWDRVKIPFTNQNYHSDETGTDVDAINKNCYFTTNKLRFRAVIGSTSDPVAHTLTISQFFSFLYNIIDSLVSTASDTHVSPFELSIDTLSLTYFPAKLSGSDAEKYVNLFRPIKLNRNNPLMSQIIEDYLPSVLSDFEGDLCVNVTWNSNYYGDSFEEKTYIE